MNPSGKKMVMMQKIFNPSQYRLNSNLGTLNKENYIRFMSESINKAINSDEGPVKEKHVRRLLIASFQFENAQFFWENLPVIRLKENQIVCWKFCHVLHKLIRDGHRQALVNCSERRQVLLDCGNLWRHVQTGYGPLIHAYCELLFNRIKFHNGFPDFPNDLRLTDEQLDAFEAQDTTGNLLYEMGVEMLESIDAILLLSNRVLESLSTKRLSSTSNAGRSHLAPLVACIQDSSLFYDTSVKLLFKLHARLSAGFMQFLRERFNECHKGMREFYSRVRNLQYFRTLIQIPSLSEKPPNFLVASELKQHITPQVIMISETNERESPDHGLLVNLDEDDVTSPTDDLDSTISGTTLRNATESEASNSLSVETNGNLDCFFESTISNQVAQSTHKSNLELEALSKRIHELESTISSLSEELEREREDHRQTSDESRKQKETSEIEITKFKNEISNMKHQLSASKKAYDRLLEEAERAKHDSEISQEAMKRLVKEISELKSKRLPESNIVQKDVTKEKDTREEEIVIAGMNEIDKIIKEATTKLEELNEKARNSEAEGTKLTVNEKISEACTNLIKAVKILIAQSRILQKEIVASEVKGASPEEFYKRNSDWTEGLNSAANKLAYAARSLIDAADRAVSEDAGFHQIAAEAHAIYSRTAQLMVASRIKANRDSEKLKLLSDAAKQVNKCTSHVVDVSRVCARLQEDVDEIDIANLSLHQTKQLEMETQVRLLELEDSLTKERTKLGLLRRKHYEQEEAQSAMPKDM